MLVKRIILEDGNKRIEKDDEILCEIINDKGENKVQFISKAYLELMGIMLDSSSTSISGASLTDNTECKTDKMTEKENIDNSAKSKEAHRWTDNETKYLLDQYRIYFPQIGPFRAFKNKFAMFEQLGKDLYTKFNIKVSGQQCINRYKNALKLNKKALLDNKVSGNTPTEVPYNNEFEEIKSINNSLEPEVFVGVNRIEMSEKNMGTIQNKKYDTSDSDNQEYEKPRKRLKHSSMEQVLRDISATAEENRERRHKEKCDLLISLLGKPTKSSE